MGFGFFKAGAIIFNKADPGDYFLLTISGKIDLYMPNPQI
jgi:CRP-like cAMP-binding protein